MFATHHAGTVAARAHADNALRVRHAQPRRANRALAIVLCLTWLAMGGYGCRSSERARVGVAPSRPDIPLSGKGNVSRTALTYDQLMNGFAAASPVDEAALAIPDGAAQPEHVFEGRLELLDESIGGGFELLHGQDEGSEMRHLPEFDFEFVHSGSYLIPARRGLVITGHPKWNYLIEPGRVWRENSDHGYTRASFPFALVVVNGNAIFNGVMTFLFNPTGISKAWYQVTQETTTNTTANFWGLLNAAYHPAPMAGAEQMRRSFARELADRFLTQPIEQLAVDHPGIDLLIKDYVPEAARSPGDWSQVTFNHALDMATGNYRSAGYMADEEGRIFDQFFGAETYADKIAVAAMQNFLRAKEGALADIFQFVVDEVYKPIKMGPGVFSTTRTSENNWQGQPIGSFGMWWTADDIAKITALLNGGGAHDGEQILHPALLAAALQWEPGDRGVDIGPGAKYNNAFWSSRYGVPDGYRCEFWVPYMAGYSGDVVTLMPNHTAYYYFSDNREFTWGGAVRESNKIAPHCR